MGSECAERHRFHPPRERVPLGAEAHDVALGGPPSEHRLELLDGGSVPRRKSAPHFTTTAWVA